MYTFESNCKETGGGSSSDYWDQELFEDLKLELERC
jgi:hypothetical protein